MPPWPCQAIGAASSGHPAANGHAHGRGLRGSHKISTSEQAAGARGVRCVSPNLGVKNMREPMSFVSPQSRSLESGDPRRGPKEHASQSPPPRPRRRHSRQSPPHAPPKSQPVRSGWTTRPKENEPVVDARKVKNRASAENSRNEKRERMGEKAFLEEKRLAEATSRKRLTSRQRVDEADDDD